MLWGLRELDKGPAGAERGWSLQGPLPTSGCWLYLCFLKRGEGTGKGTAGPGFLLRRVSTLSHNAGETWAHGFLCRRPPVGARAVVPLQFRAVKKNHSYSGPSCPVPLTALIQ